MILLGAATESVVEDALVQIARHTPPDTEIGKPRAATADDNGAVQILTGKRTVWQVDPDNVERYVPLGDGTHCYTSWRWGVVTADLVGYDEPQEA